MPERVVLWCQSFFYGSVIDSPKVTHIERYGIHAYTSGFQVGFIHEHQIRTDAINRHVLLFAECQKAIERSSISF